MTSAFGPRWGGTHNGVDWGAPTGTPVFSWRGGVVTRVSTKGNYGLLVVVDHGEGIATWYAHNSRILVTQGQIVGRREKIALVGESGLATGPHLHFEVRINNKPIDPLPFLKQNP
jgi:murein DD-endopeptidase MepM/ murein hydrolase activator NlpD